jgi:hypothetical protein
MVTTKSQARARMPVNNPAPTSEDFYSVLTHVIKRASNDPAMLRKLVYALAWQNLEPEMLLANAFLDTPDQIQNILQFERAMELQRAIERVEADSAQQAYLIRKPPKPVAPTWRPVVADAHQNSTGPVSPVTYFNELVEAKEPPGGRPPVWLQESQSDLPSQLTSAHENHSSVATEAEQYTPSYRSQRSQSGFQSSHQFINTLILGIALCLGISGWIYLARQQMWAPTPGMAPFSPIVAETQRAPEMAIEPKALQIPVAGSGRHQVESTPAPLIAAAPSTPDNSLNASVFHVPIPLGQNEIQIIRDYIKMPPAPPGALPTIIVGDVLPAAKLIPLPRSIAEKLPALKDAKFTTDNNNAIIIVRGVNNRVEFVIPPK